MTKPDEMVCVRVFCPACDRIKVIGRTEGKEREPTIWCTPTEAEQTSRALDGECRYEHCPDCGGRASDRLARFGERDDDGHELGVRGDNEIR